MIFNSSSISSNIEFENIIRIETNISEKGLPTFEIFGLVTKSIEESKKRILNSFESIGIPFPLRNISINLAPAEIIKEGSHYDLAIAASILKYTNTLLFDEKADLFLGELSLDGSVREIKNALYLVLIGKKLGFRRFFIPKGSINEVLIIPDIKVFAVSNLRDLLNIDSLVPEKNNEFKLESNIVPSNFSKILGNSLSKRVLALSLAGGHHLLLNGFPGSGKSLLAKSSQELIPNLEIDAAIDVAKIYSFLGIKRSSENFFRPPFRSPHNTSSYSSIFGSAGKSIFPGELALANHGILFLDEFPEFNRLVLEGLRAPLEDKQITISRGRSKKTFDTNFILIATMNPCKCGYFNHQKLSCRCMPSDIKRYQNKISGPISDRIDLQINQDIISSNLSISEQKNYSYEEFLELKNKVFKSFKLLNSYKVKDVDSNFSQLLSNNINLPELSSKSINLIKTIQEKYSLSNRKYFKILNIARTISIFDSKENINPEAIFEALSLSGFKN